MSSCLKSPKSRLPFKANPSIVTDTVFKSRLENHFKIWKEVKESMDFMVWWDDIVKPGVKKLLIERGKEINTERRGLLNLLLFQQAYYARNFI